MNREMKQNVLAANLMLKEQGLVIFTWGNVSAIDRGLGEVVIKPSGVPYETMGVDDLVVVNMEGTVLEGKYNPSSDLATHLELYRTFTDCGGVVHTHSRFAVAWAQSGADLPAFGTTHADYFYGPIPCTRALTSDEIRGAYEHETGNVIVETFSKRKIDPMAVPGGCWSMDMALSPGAKMPWMLCTIPLSWKRLLPWPCPRWLSILNCRVLTRNFSTNIIFVNTARALITDRTGSTEDKDCLQENSCC